MTAEAHMNSSDQYRVDGRTNEQCRCDADTVMRADEPDMPISWLYLLTETSLSPVSP